MSVASLTTLGAVRDVRKPTRGDVGKAKPISGDASQDAKLKDLLITQFPTEVIAPYTLITALIIGAIAAPTAENLNPDQYEGYRWLVFIVMLITVFGLVWIVKSRKESGGTRFPLLEITGAVVAATGWAFILPESPLIPYIDSEAGRIIVPGVIGFIAVMINLLIAAALKQRAT